MITQKMQFVVLKGDKIMVPEDSFDQVESIELILQPNSYNTNPVGLIHISLHSICTVQGHDYMKFSEEFITRTFSSILSRARITSY